MNRILSIIAAFTVLTTTASAGDDQLPVIELRKNVTLTTVSPCLGDIATIQCRDERLRRNLEALEMPSMVEGAATLTVTQKQVRTRLLIAGYALDEFLLVGPTSVTATYREAATISDTDVEEAALRSVAELMGGEVRDFKVQLNSPVIQSLPKEMKELADPRITVRPQRTGLGMVPMQIQIWDGKDLKRTIPATCEVRKKHRVAVARVSLNPQQAVDIQQVAFEARYLDKPMDELTLDQIRGQSMRSGVQAGSVIQMKDIRTSSTGGRIIIRKGSLVTATAMTGRLRVSLRDAEALSDGAIGDSIRLRNRQSGEEFSGQVISSGRVLVRPFTELSENTGEFGGGFGQ
ncbi:MAG: flagellar basal body P-ring formation chaperone FlgA [Planctomycetaceae bacterium]